MRNGFRVNAFRLRLDREPAVFVSGNTNGCNPVGLVLDTSGNLYGSTNNGGPNNEGTIYELVNSAGSWTYNQIYAFPASLMGTEPNGPLTFDASGNLWERRIMAAWKTAAARTRAAEPYSN